jgi:hypothetical protein
VRCVKCIYCIKQRENYLIRAHLDVAA